MAILQSPLKEKFESLVNQSNDEFDKGNHNESITLLEEAWSVLPNPKGIYNESFDLVNDIIDTCFIVKDFKTAKNGQIKCF